MKKIKVTNRSNGSIGYFIPELNIRRTFGPYESKTIDEEEIQKIMYQDGGYALVNSYLLIEDKEAANKYSPEYSKEPEYWMDKDNIIKVMTSGSLDEFLDFLDFCPLGSLETVKDLAVSLPLTDTNKMKAIQNKTGMNVYNAIQNKDIDESTPAETAIRRVKQVESTPAVTPKYRRVESKVE